MPVKREPHIGPDPHPNPFDDARLQPPDKLGIMPLGPGVRLGGKSLEDLLGSVLETPGRRGALSSMRVSGYDPEEETLRLHNTKTGTPIDTDATDLAKLMHSGSVERQGASTNAGLSLESLIRKMSKYVPGSR